MLSVALYARYSSDNQRDASIEDQLRLCRERAEREGWRIVDSYNDRSVSGASLIRPGVQAMMQDAQAGRFNLVLAESLDRISRDQEDIAGVYKRLTFAGVRMVTLSEGAQRTAHRPEGDDGRAVSEGPRRQDPSRPARPGRGRQVRRRQQLWLQGCA